MSNKEHNKSGRPGHEIHGECAARHTHKPSKKGKGPLKSRISRGIRLKRSAG